MAYWLLDKQLLFPTGGRLDSDVRDRHDAVREKIDPEGKEVACINVARIPVRCVLVSVEGRGSSPEE